METFGPLQGARGPRAQEPGRSRYGRGDEDAARELVALSRHVGGGRGRGAAGAARYTRPGHGRELVEPGRRRVTAEYVCPVRPLPCQAPVWALPRPMFTTWSAL
jgi:hypothetical protein